MSCLLPTNNQGRRTCNSGTCPSLGIEPMALGVYADTLTTECTGRASCITLDKLLFSLLYVVTKFLAGHMAAK